MPRGPGQGEAQSRSAQPRVTRGPGTVSAASLQCLSYPGLLLPASLAACTVRVLLCSLPKEEALLNGRNCRRGTGARDLPSQGGRQVRFTGNSGGSDEVWSERRGRRHPQSGERGAALTDESEMDSRRAEGPLLREKSALASV